VVLVLFDADCFRGGAFQHGHRRRG
jgi:hypothetical protein